MASLGLYEQNKLDENLEFNPESTSCNSILKYVDTNNDTQEVLTT